MDFVFYSYYKYIIFFVLFWCYLHVIQIIKCQKNIIKIVFGATIIILLVEFMINFIINNVNIKSNNLYLKETEELNKLIDDIIDDNVN